MENLNSLEEARINIVLDMENMKWNAFCGAVLSLMTLVSNAKHLYFCGKCMEALDGNFELPVFRNLTKLELGCNKWVYWRGVLREFLQSSPILEELIFPEGLLNRRSDDDYEEKNFWTKQRKAPPCVSSHLKAVVIKYFNGWNEELQIATYFVKHGKVLTLLLLDWAKVSLSKQEQRELMKLYVQGDGQQGVCNCLPA